MEKNIAIIILSLIIIGLIWLIFSGKSESNALIAEISEQRIEFSRSTAVIEFANSRLREESEKLRSDYNEATRNNTELESENNEYKRTLDDIRIGSRETGEYLSEYGGIIGDFAEFIRQAGVED